MKTKHRENSAIRFLLFLREEAARCAGVHKHRVELTASHGSVTISARGLAALVTADLVAREGERVILTQTGRAHLARLLAGEEPFLRQHGGIVAR